MYTLLIVDDESIIRRGIHYHIDWKNHGIEVIGEARDGEEGYQQALKLQPDIIITDIRMPKMNGIQMAEKIRSVLPDIAIIFLTGYEEKEYLLSAIRFGINDYIMKSANSQSILDSVMRLKGLLDEKQEKSSFKVEQLLNDCLGTIKSSFITSLFSDISTTESVVKQAQVFDFPIMGPSYLPILIPAACSEEPDNLILAILFHLKQWHPCVCWQNQYGIVGFLNIQKGEDCITVISQMVEKLKEDYSEVQIIVGRGFTDLSKAAECFQSMLRVAAGLCWYPEESLLFQKEILFPEIPKDILYLMETEIIKAYHAKNTTEFIGKMEQFFDFAKQSALPLDQFKESFQRMVISFTGDNSKQEDTYRILSVIDEYSNPEKIYQYILDAFVGEMPKIVHNSIVELARNYIREHYAQNIGLKEIAEYCHVSPSYISKIFKNDIQIGIVQYIHNMRIDKAKELLRNTDMRVTEIAPEVGYSDYKRFSFYFLKIVGVSPRDYRKGDQAESQG